MNPVTTVQALTTGCQWAVQARGLGAAAFAIAIAAVEAWLRVPVRPTLDGHLQAAIGRVASLVTALRKLSV